MGDNDAAWAQGCDWPVTVAIPTETSWPSGFYHIVFRSEGGEAGGGTRSDLPRADAFFVLRPRSPSGMLLVLSTNTYNAYNQWGGRCLYSGATHVSFARPLERGYLHRSSWPDGFDGRLANVATPSDPEHQTLQRYQSEGQWPLWSSSSGWHNWERRFMRWAESTGFEVQVAVNADLEFRPEILDGQRALLTVGHDEYWSAAMRDNVDDWVGSGGNWAIFSGNTCFWQVRYQDEGRTMVCYKDRARTYDPIAGSGDTSTLTSIWSDPFVGRPENLSIGLTFTRGGYYRMGQAVADGPGTYTIHRPDHWALAGTGLEAGDELGANSFIVAYEADGCDLTWVAGRPEPTGIDGTPGNLEIVATAPARLVSITDDHCEAPEPLWASVEPPGDLESTAAVLFGDASPDNVAKIANGHAVMGSFTKGEGAVFNAGTTDWAYGLGIDPAVDRITSNVLRRFSGSAK